MLTKALISPFSLNDVIDIRSYEKRATEAICPSCRARVIAKQGKIKQWHFAHANSKECEYARETELHLMAKASINPGDIFYLPELRNSSKKILKPETVVQVDDVIVEHQLSNIKPDLVIISNGHRLLVEIAVTHFVDLAKKRKIENLGVSCLEINLASCHISSFNYSDEHIRDLVLNGQYRKKWIYHRRAEDLDQQKQKKIQDEFSVWEQSIKTKIFRNLTQPEHLIDLQLTDLQPCKRAGYDAEFEALYNIFDREELIYLSLHFYNTLDDFQSAFLKARCKKVEVDIEIMKPAFSYLKNEIFSTIKNSRLTSSSTC